MSKYLIHDARTLSEVVDNNVDLIVTSPPYFDLKDYGSSNQIGFGQGYKAYLEDMERVLEQCFIVTKDTGSMWLIVDTLKKNGNFVLLPFDLCKIAEKAGWKLQEIIVWKKDRTLPYSRKGEMRNIFEYVLLFVKSNNFKYYPKRITDFDLKEWWIKYPERYSTAGKVPTDIWEFPIPVQGSWGKSYIRHFCPLPSRMIDRIIQLCTDANDVVFDPFAGSGAVLVEAHRLKREYVGCDLNPEFKSMFEEYLKTVKKIDTNNFDKNRDLFSTTIGKLRILKLPSAVLKSLRRLDPSLLEEVEGVIVEQLKGTPKDKNKHWRVKYTFIVPSGNPEVPVRVQQVISKAPLTKYGVEAETSFVQKTHIMPKYEYRWAATHKEPEAFSGSVTPFVASDLTLSTKERALIVEYEETGQLKI